jgi:hypothetical protein
MFGVPGGDGVFDYFFFLAGRRGKGQMVGVSGDASTEFGGMLKKEELDYLSRAPKAGVELTERRLEATIQSKIWARMSLTICNDDAERKGHSIKRFYRCDL